MIVTILQAVSSFVHELTKTGIPRPRLPLRSVSRAASRLAALGCVIGVASLSAAAEPAAPVNSGFEDGLSGWHPGDTMSKTVSEAARTGKLGLRVTDDDKTKGSSLRGSQYPARGGQTVTLSFHARADSRFLAVYFWPVDANGRMVKDPALGRDGLHSVVVNKSEDWRPYTLSATMPAGTVAVSLWVHSWSGATGVADLDDFLLDGVAPVQTGDTTTAAATPARAAPETLSGKHPERAAPPIIILKLDDLRQVGGGVHPTWTRVADYLAARNIKSGIGVICQTLKDATPAYCDWIRSRHDSGLVEFWFHGWDHAPWKTDAGKKLSEFDGRPFEDQWKRFADSQTLAKEKLGFAFATFGPGGGGSGRHQDAATAQAMAQDPDMKVWLYPSPIDALGRELAAQGKITILDRVWAVNLESQVGQPSYERFLAGYARNAGREYFVLQGHPTNWSGDRFAEFGKIIDFLVAQKAVFMTAREYAASLGRQPALRVGGS